MSLFGKLLGVFISTTNNDPSVLATNMASEAGVPVAVESADPTEKDFQKLLADDDASQQDVDKMIRDNQSFVAKGAGVPNEELNRRIREKLEGMQHEYELFLGQHPNHARAIIAYGSFLEDTKNEEAAAEQWEKARLIDPKNPAVWNNLANYYGHQGPVTNAFVYYAQAITLNPTEPIYYQNFGTTVYLFRTDAKEFYHITEQQVFDKALDLYAHAQKLAPDDFPLATDIAQTYYGIKPMRTEAALRSWTNALNDARDEIEREGVYIHLARIKMGAGQFTEAQKHLNAVTNGMYNVLKARLQKNLDAKEKGANVPDVTNILSDAKIWRFTSVPPTNKPAADAAAK